MQLSSHSAIETHADVQHICQPIFNLFNLNFFRYLRVYPDKTRIHLCNDPHWTSLFYEKNFYNIAWCDANTPDKFTQQELIWDTKALTDDNIVGVTARLDFNMHHGISIVRSHAQYYEVFDFATEQKNVEINNHYMHSFDYFERFIFYFKDHAKSLINASDKKRIIIPSISENKINQLSMEKIKKFLKETKTKRFYINRPYGDVYLTIREVECIYWAFCGKSTKEISHIMQCSTRTIDDHINGIKLKLNANKITQLIRICHEAGIFKAYDI